MNNGKVFFWQKKEKKNDSEKIMNQKKLNIILIKMKIDEEKRKM